MTGRPFLFARRCLRYRHDMAPSVCAVTGAGDDAALDGMEWMGTP